MSCKHKPNSSPDHAHAIVRRVPHGGVQVMYDDSGGAYDHVVPPFEGVPHPKSPCNVRT